jgi:hypothetical protein
MKQILIALDQLLNALFGGMADETISAHAYRSNWRIRMAIINFIFFDKNHCMDSFISEQQRLQLPKRYREVFNEQR